MAEDLLTLDQLSPEARKLLGHDLRYAVFMKLGERPRNAKELERELGISVKEISRQIRTLGKADLVELVSTPTGPRGGLLHKYRAVRHVFDASEWEQFPAAHRERLSVRITRTLIREVTSALADGSFDSHRDRVLGRRPVELDDAGAERVAAILTRADEEVAQASAESLERGGETRSWVSAVLAFPTAE